METIKCSYCASVCEVHYNSGEVTTDEPEFCPFCGQNIFFEEDEGDGWDSVIYNQ